MSEWDFCSSALPLIIQCDCEKAGFIFACSCFTAVTRVLWFCRCKANIMTLAPCISSGDGESSFLVNREILMKMQLEEFFCTKKTVYPTVDALCLWCPGTQGKWKTMEMFYHLSFPPTPPLPSLVVSEGWFYCARYSSHRASAANASLRSPHFGACMLGAFEKLNGKSQLKTTDDFQLWRSCPRSYAASSGL